MKKLLLLMPILLIASQAFCQTFKIDSDFVAATNKVKPAKIDTIVISSLNKTQLYSNSISYLLNSFKDTRNVIEFKDADLGQIAFTGNVIQTAIDTTELNSGKPSYYSYGFKVYFKGKIIVKDKKFKIILSSLEVPISQKMELGVKFSVETESPDFNLKNNNFAKRMIVNLIQDMSRKINRKSDADF